MSIAVGLSANAMPATRQESQTRIEMRCSEQGLRMTGQRRTVARVLSAAKDHPDVEEVHRRASALDARISLSTVYRTLKLFAEKGILERHDFGQGGHSRGRYEVASRRHHDHLVDIVMGSEGNPETVTIATRWKDVAGAWKVDGISRKA